MKGDKREEGFWKPRRDAFVIASEEGVRDGDRDVLDFSDGCWLRDDGRAGVYLHPFLLDVFIEVVDGLDDLIAELLGELRVREQETTAV